MINNDRVDETILYDVFKCTLLVSAAVTIHPHDHYITCTLKPAYKHFVQEAFENIAELVL